jgi:cytochrome c oxidase subunit 1
MAAQEIRLSRPRQRGQLLIDRLHGNVVIVGHKKPGLASIGIALIFLTVAGIMALAIRLQIALTNNELISPDVINCLFTMRRTAVVFLVGVPFAAGLRNFLIPIMIGSRDMSFPRLYNGQFEGK